MIRRPIVLLDADGPLAKFTESYLGAFEEETGEAATIDQVDEWSITNCAFFRAAADRLGVPAFELRRRVDAHVSRPGFCYAIAPQPEALEAVPRIAKRAEIYVVTSPWESQTWMYERAQWLKRWFKIPAFRVFHAHEKFLVRGDVFVDDKPSHVEAWAKAWPGRAAILFDMHHNRDDVSASRGGWDLVHRVVESDFRQEA